MNFRTAGSLLQLRKQLNELYPKRSKTSDGTIGDAAHAARASDHNPNKVGVVTAMDITHDPSNGVDIAVLAQQLVDSRDPRIKYIIRNGQYADTATKREWRKYTGENGHFHHMHISVQGNYDSEAKWKIGDDMRKPTKDEVYWQYKLVGGIEPSKDEVESYLKSGKDYITVMEEIKKFYADKGLDFFTFKKSVRKDEDKIKAAERIIQAVEAAKEIK
jgi:hypothetical protein